ncbi:DUF1385 domain-containing protein [Myxococcota bacterium]|nr:DUF1385 domain-containing protein [Myxococcota bacterium]
MPDLLNVGGQAVIEGVMMRGPRSMVIAVRKPDGSIVVKDGEWIPIVQRLPVLKLPFLRGAVVMIEAMVNGVQALSFSANAALGVEGEQPDGAVPDSRQVALSTGAIAGSLVLSMAMGAGLFIYAPHFLASVALNLAAGRALLAEADVSNPLFHGVVGALKMAIFVGYIVAISRIPDIRRVFQYHGAEHKSIFAYESGEDLTVENARRHSTLHPRCGTSFLFFVIMISIGVFAAVLPLIPMPGGLRGFQLNLFQASVKLPLMFPIAGLSYEFIRWAGKRRDSAVLRALAAPGLLMQRLTTREPEDAQIEVALVSLKRALELEGALAEPRYDNCVFLPRAAEA